MKVYAAFILLMLIPTVFTTRRANAEADSNWKARMQSMAASVTCLAPFVASDAKFNDLKNHLQINSCVDDLWAQTKDLKDGLSKHAAANSSDALLQRDPLLPYMADSFAEDVEMARSLVNSASSAAYAQHLLRGTLSYCAGCHTRQEAAAATKFPVFKDLTKDLSITDRMKLFAATRNFDRALETFTEGIRSNEVEKLGPLELERAARLALSIAVRVDQNETSALKIIAQIKKLKTVSPALKDELTTWETSLKTKDVAQTGSLLERARTLIRKAEATQSGLQARVPQIHYLRASSLLHKFVATDAKPIERAEALSLLADCYEHLETLGFWSTSDIYNEACIRTAPHTEIARQCFGPYKDSITLGYSGSAGINIPSNVQASLRELETLSKPLKSSASKK